MRAIEKRAGWWLTLKPNPRRWCLWHFDHEDGFGVIECGPICVEWWG